VAFARAFQQRCRAKQLAEKGLLNAQEKPSRNSSKPPEIAPKPSGGELENLTAESGTELLHGLNNAVLTILLNSQLIHWKLPTYSNMRRNVHQVERSVRAYW